MSALDGCPRDVRFCSEQGDGTLVFAIAPSPFRKGWVEVVQHCNLRCIHCNVLSFEKAAAEIPVERYADHVVPLYRSLGVTELWLSGGEPTLHKRFQDIVRFSAAGGFRTTVITNGSRITPDLARLFQEHGTFVQLSMEGPDAETHDLIRGRGTFRRVSAALDVLVQGGLAPRLAIGSSLTSYSIGRLPDLVEVCLQHGVARLILTPVKRLGAAAREPIWNELRTGIEERIDAFKWIRRKEQELHGRLSIHLSGGLLEPHEYEPLGIEPPAIRCAQFCEEIQCSVSGDLQLCPRMDRILRSHGGRAVNFDDMAAASADGKLRLPLAASGAGGSGAGERSTRSLV